MEIQLIMEKIQRKYTDILNSAVPANVFRAAYLLLLVIHCIENTSVKYLDVEWINGMYLFRNALYLVLAARLFFLAEFQRQELIWAGAFFAAGCLSFLGTRDFGLMEFILIMLSAKGESPRWLISVFMTVKAAAVFVTLFLWRIGVLAAVYYQDDDVGFYNTYGFIHRNVLAANITVICLAWFYFRWKKIKVLDVAVWSTIALLSWPVAQSRTGLILLFLIIFGMFFGRRKRKWIRYIPELRKIVLICLIAFILISVIGTLLYSDDSVFWKVVDSIFTKRFKYANQCLEEYGLSLFGQQLPLVSTMEAQTSGATRLILDNSYMRAVLYYGIVPGGMFLGAYFQALSHSARHKNVRLLICLLLFAVYGLSESYLLDVNYQFALVIAWNRYFFKESGEAGTEYNGTVPEHIHDVIRQYRERTK